MKTNTYKTLALAVCAVIFSIPANAQIPDFTRVDTGTLVQEVIRGRGVYLVDLDGDSDLDLYIGNSTGYSFTGAVYGKNRPNLVYRNERNSRFVKITEGILATKIYNTNPGNNWGDFDNDGDWDLFNHGELFVNDGFGNIEQVITINNKSEFCGTWADYNSDGYLDIFTNVVGDNNYMYKNNGDGTFSDVSVGSPTTEGLGQSQSSAWADSDNDGDLDIFEANVCVGSNTLYANKLYVNEGDGTFSSIGNNSPLVEDLMGAGGAAWGDYDNDGDMDIYVVSLYKSVNLLFKNNGDLNFEKIIIEPEEAYDKFTYGSTWGDFNNDGHLDLFVAVINSEYPIFGVDHPFKENLFFINQGDGTFTRKLTGDIITDGAEATAANDIDNDGDLDLIITHGNLASPFLTYVYQNNGNDNNWLNITCEGVISNKSAIGTRVSVKANIGGNTLWMTRELTQENGLHACNGPRLHFGLGSAEKADSIIVKWPSGEIDNYVNVKANHFYNAIEDDKLEIDFKATNYIQYSPALSDIEFMQGETRSIDLKNHYQFIMGDTVPEITSDTLVFEIINENPEIVSANLNGNILMLLAGDTIGDSKIKIIVSAGFTERMDNFTVKRGTDNIPDYTNENSVMIIPNPFTTETTIEYELSQPQTVTITFYNQFGKLVDRIEQKHSAGKQRVVWTPNLPGGIYYFRLDAGEQLASGKVMLVR